MYGTVQCTCTNSYGTHDRILAIREGFEPDVESELNLLKGSVPRAGTI